MNAKVNKKLRIICVAALFVIICLIYAVRMINIKTNAKPKQESLGAYTRTVAIQAVRGEIFDRNGKCLVSNEYTYDMIFDHQAMSVDRYGRNMAILRAVEAVEEMQETARLPEYYFIFDGEYPNYTYTKDAITYDTDIYLKLLKRIAENELEEDSQKKKNELTATYLDEFYREHGECFPKEQEIIDCFVEKYSLDEKDENGAPRYTDAQIDKIFRVLYDMEVSDFSAYNSYVFAENVDMRFITYMEELGISGVDFKVEISRVYNYPGYASHILGRVGQIYSEEWDYYNELGYEMSALVGKDGCEAAFESYLRGVDGEMEIIEDENGKIIEKKVKKSAISGKDLYLTIDIDLQIAAEDGLRENVNYVNSNVYSASSEAGALVALDPNSGAVLALASYPSYDLSTFNKDYNDLVADSANPLYNRALDGLYTPGSTFKLGMVAAGIDSSEVSSSTTLRCDGIYTYYKDYQPKCWIHSSGGRHGNINAAGAIEVSCNCYFYELGRRMGIDKMNNYCRKFGLGEKTGIELPEKIGILAGPAYRETHGMTAWTAGNTISAAIGQSDNSFTPIQLSAYVSTLLNGGTRYSAHLLGEVKTYGNGEIVYSSTPRELDSIELSGEATDTVKYGMKRMVENSAFVSSYMKNIPVTVGGKTGTAELGGTATENGLFVCAAPYDKPEIVITSVVEHAGGGSYAAIAAARVLEEYYD